MSLFEPHTVVIRKGIAPKPNELGRLVRIDEVENGIVSGYQVLVGNLDDSTSWMPALEQHQASFGQAPEMATADRGFYSAKNERQGQDLGVKEGVLLAARKVFGEAGRDGATISTLKHPFSMWRATYKGGWASSATWAGV